MRETKKLNAKEMLEAIVLNKNIQTEEKKPLNYLISNEK